MAEIGDGSYGYIDHVALYVLSRVALPTGDPAGLAQARRSAARLGQVRESPASAWARASWPWWAMPKAACRWPLRPECRYSTRWPAARCRRRARRMYADSATLTRILLDADRGADAESVVARLEGFATLQPDFPFLDCATLHARAVLDGDPDIALRVVALGGSPRRLVRVAVLEDAGRLLPGAHVAEAVPLLETAPASYAAA